MEEKIMQMEAEADVLRTPYTYSGTTGSFNAADAEKRHKVDEQLQALKNKLNTPPAEE
jgi:phage shock protein A